MWEISEIRAYRTTQHYCPGGPPSRWLFNINIRIRPAAWETHVFEFVGKLSIDRACWQMEDSDENAGEEPRSERECKLIVA